MAYLIHEIFQRTGLPPDEFWAKSRGSQMLMLASMELVLKTTPKEDGFNGYARRKRR